MELQFFGKNVEITDDISDYARKKTEKLGRYLSRIEESKVEISQEKTRSPRDRYTVQITLRSKGNILRAEEKASTINLAIDSAANSLERQISRFKGRFSRKGKGEPSGGAVEVEAEKAAKVKSPRIARVKRFIIQSMSTKEAADQMEMLNHDFFMFMNADTGSMNVIYRRKDGHYGVIESEIENE
jgi:putative sigma-54 modulation protein